MPLIRSSRRAIIASLLVAVLGAVTTAPSIVAPNEILEISHKGVHLIGVPPDPRANYDVPATGIAMCQHCGCCLKCRQCPVVANKRSSDHLRATSGVPSASDIQDKVGNVSG